MGRTGMKPVDGHGGFSLLEVMIALVVLTVGLLGLAAMQDIALSRNVDANELSLGTNLAAEMMERVQYSRKSVASYNGIDVSSTTATCPATPSMTNGDCTQWRANLLLTQLPNVRGTVQVVTVGPASLNQWQVTVQVRWTGLILPLTFSSVVSLG